VRSGKFSKEELRRTVLENENNFSVVKDAMLATEGNVSAITSMHDPTEGGIAGALHEMADASGRGFRIYKDKIPVAEMTLRICDFFRLDVLTLIASGALLATVRPDCVATLLNKYKAAGLPADDIGLVVEDGSERNIVIGNSQTPLTRPLQDSLWDALKNTKNFGVNE